MLTRFWFQTDRGLGYGVTANSQADAEDLLKRHGYPLPTERVIAIKRGIAMSALDKNDVLPNVGPLAVRGVWFPCRNL